MERLGDVLNELRDQIPLSLLAGEGWERLLERVGDLPAVAASSLCGFEFRLDESAPWADFSAPVSREKVAHHHIVRGEAAAPMSVDAWLAAHLNDSSATDHWLESVLLAYDIIGVPPGRPEPPVLYLRLLSGHGKGGIAADPAAIARTVAQASARTGSAPEHRALAWVLGALPAGATLAYVGATPNREPRSLRLLVADMDAQEIGPLLTQLEWPGSITAVDCLLNDMAGLCRHFVLLFDVNEDGALPRLGFEMHAISQDITSYRALFAAWLISSKHDWKPVIERLVDRRLCIPDKAEGLLSWPRLRTVFGTEGAFELYMGLNHIKLSIEGDSLRAKAYGGLRLLPLDEFAKEAFLGS